MMMALLSHTLILCLLSPVSALNFTLGFMTHRSDNYNGAAVSIALDTIRSQGFMFVGAQLQVTLTCSSFTMLLSFMMRHLNFM